MERIVILFPALLGLSTVNAQNVLQRLQNDTMPNVVPNPGFEESARTFCAAAGTGCGAEGAFAGNSCGRVLRGSSGSCTQRELKEMVLMMDG